MIVADTNLLAYLLLPGEHTALAEQVLQRDPEWAAPLLWRSEFRSVLALYLRRQLISQETAVEVFRQAARIVDGREYEVSADRVLGLVARSDCSAYDCEFAALALELDVPLVTSDKAILTAFPAAAASPAKFLASR